MTTMKFEKAACAAKSASAVVAMLVLMALTTVFVASLAPVEAAMMRPAFFSGKWAASEQLCSASGAAVEIMPGKFKYAGAVGRMATKVTYYQAKSDMVEVGLSHPAMTAKIVLVAGEGGSLQLKSADVVMRDMSEGEWRHLTKMSNGAITRRSVEAMMANFRAEMASSADRLVRCSASA